LVAGPPEVAQLAASADRLEPAQCVLDQHAPALAAVVARVPGRPIVDRAATTLFVLRDVRRHLRAAQILAKSRVS